MRRRKVPYSTDEIPFRTFSPGANLRPGDRAVLGALRRARAAAARNGDLWVSDEGENQGEDLLTRIWGSR